MVDLAVFTYPIKKGRTSTISGIIDFGDSGLGDPAYDFAGILSSFMRFFDMCINLYPNGIENSDRRWN